MAYWLPMPIKRTFYHLGYLSRVVRWALNRVAPTGLTEVTIAGGDLAGARLLLDMQTEKDYWLGTYEPELQDALRDWVKPGWVAYDVGANIGYISLLLARTVGSKGSVFAFEALPTNLERLRVNMSLNPSASKITVVPAAVTNILAQVRFMVGPSGGMGKVEGSAGRQEKYNQIIEVAGITLDDFVYTQAQPVPQVIKIDIEGGEVLAFPGMHRLLVEKKPLLFLELHGFEASKVVWEILTQAGYTICRMTPGYPVVYGWETLDWKAHLMAKSS
jgi:FkbM family methyltransferase